jgi:hypothetical protein
MLEAPVLQPCVDFRLGILAVAMGMVGCRSDINIVSKGPTEEESQVVVEEFSHDWGQWLSMGVLPDGRPVAAFYDATMGAVGFAIATLNADGTVSWAYEEPDGYPDSGGLDPGNRGKYVDMAVAPNGDVWLAYQDINNEVLRYARRYYLSGVWETGAADSDSNPSSSSGLFASVAIDGSGNPVVAHYDGGLGNLRVAHWNGSGFVGEVVDEGDAPEVAEGEDPIDADVGQFPSIQIVNGVEYIAYYDKANGDLLLASGGAGAYSFETIASDGDVGAWPDLLVHDGDLHISFHDVGNQDLLYTVGAPGSWDTRVVDDGEYVGADSELIVTSSGVRIAYFDGHNNDMMVATQVGDDWTVERRAGEDTAMGFFNELIETGGRVYVGCYDYTARKVWFSPLD